VLSEIYKPKDVNCQTINFNGLRFTHMDKNRLIPCDRGDS